MSAEFNQNSTIWELEETAQVAYLKGTKRAVALPLLAKISNKKLSLTDYRLDPEHFEALQSAFMKDSTLLE